MDGGADSVTCTRCGGALHVAALTTSLVCPHCRTHVELGPEQIETLGRYGQEVQGRLEGARRELQQAESWNRFYGGGAGAAKGSLSSSWLGPIAVGVGVMVVMAIAGSLASALKLARVAKVLPLGIFGLFVVAYVYWYYGGARSAGTTAPALASARVSCPKCGAPNELLPGEVLDQCRFCKASLLAGQRVMQHGRAEAERALFFAEIERSRAERRGMAALSASSGASRLPYVVLGSFLPMTVLGAIGYTVSSLAGEVHGAGIGRVLVAWVPVTANIGLLAVVHQYRRRRRERIEQVLRALAARWAGTLLPDVRAVNGWLDRHWAGSVPVEQMLAGAYFCAASGVVEGFPVLAVANPVGVSRDYRGFVSVRLSAWHPAPQAASSHPSVEAATAAFRELGFSLSFERPGPVALAVEADARRFVASDATAMRLADALALLARVARELGATPADIA